MLYSPSLINCYFSEEHSFQKTHYWPGLVSTLDRCFSRDMDKSDFGLRRDMILNLITVFSFIYFNVHHLDFNISHGVQTTS